MADGGEQKEETITCELCHVECKSVFSLCYHVGGLNHRKRHKRAFPGSFPFLHKLQYFIDTYMGREPLVGLECVEEIGSRPRYKYNCLLCGFHGYLKPALRHIDEPDHISKYLDTHHPQMSVDRDLYPQNDEYVKALQQAAAKVCEIYGRKQITETCDDDSGPTAKKGPKTSSASMTAPVINGGAQARLLRCPETKVHQRPEEVLRFKGNGDFLRYLQKFQIRSDNDARIINQIMQNCTRALESFQQEQDQKNEPRGEVPHINCGGHSEKVAPAPIPQTDVTQLFLSKIKNMEETEVKSVLHKIAATNPAFREIDVPNVLKYLQASGRLNPS